MTITTPAHPANAWPPRPPTTAGVNPAKWLKVDASKVDFKSLGIDVFNSTDVLDLSSMQKAMSSCSAPTRRIWPARST